MQQGLPQPIALADYQAPDYRTVNADLIFDIRDGVTEVTRGIVKLIDNTKLNKIHQYQKHKNDNSINSNILRIYIIIINSLSPNGITSIIC